MREPDFRCFYKNGKNPDLDTNLRKISRNISRKGQNIFRKTDVLCDRKDLRAVPRQSRGIVQPPIVPELSPTTNRSILYLGRSRKRRSVSASRPAAVTTRPKPRARHKAIRRESNRRSSAKQSVRRRPFPANSCPHITMPGLLRRKRGRDPPVAAPLPILRAERSAIADLGTHHIEQLAGNHLLARLVVLYRQFLQQLGRVIGSHLASRSSARRARQRSSRAAS